MKKTTAHIILCFGDIFCFLGLWLGYTIFQHLFLEISNQADVIKFSNRLGFFILGFFLPLIHFLTIVEHFRPDFIHGHKRLMNHGAIVMVIVLFTAGFIGSSWIRTQAENAGYHYCRPASGMGGLSKTLVYTRNVAVCEDLAAAE